MGMARHYRQYLIDEYGLNPLKAGKGLPFFVELVGAVQKTQPVLGVPMSVVYPMTTFSQAREIIDRLKQSNLSNIKVRYLGWLEGGLNHVLPSTVSHEPSLGTYRQLAGLRDFARDSGVELYLDVGFLSVHRSLLSSREVARYAVRGIDRNTVLVYDYDQSTQKPLDRTGKYLIKPTELGSILGGFLGKFRDLGAGLSINDMGRQVNSDPDRKASLALATAYTETTYESQRAAESQRGGTDRGEAREMVASAFEKIVSELGDKPLVSGGNAYALPYAGSLIDVPIVSSGYAAESESVPFYQIVVHGLFEYAGPSLNLSQDMKRSLLRSIETAAGLRVTLTYKPSSDLKGTDFAGLYSTSCSDWLDPALTLTGQLDSILGHLTACAIVNHEKLAPSVYKTTFDNGQAIIVNYDDRPADVGGVAVDAMSFRLIDEEVVAQ